MTPWLEMVMIMKAHIIIKNLKEIFKITSNKKCHPTQLLTSKMLIWMKLINNMCKFILKNLQNLNIKVDLLGSKDFSSSMISSFLKNVVKKFCSIWNSKSIPRFCSSSCLYATFQSFGFTFTALTWMTVAKIQVLLNPSLKDWRSIL